ncbi:hypothetical protein OEZ85_012968 [Tetradesmus obliquus]|uniref:Uncharacterized protein n=1 Tax=Tetradesmus obliquus TaxID=3088 RepID=A0ABY8U8A5_TETOB|nr:hypothetical protein OEZ85_012968 [Tetradesmus obliquus]
MDLTGNNLQLRQPASSTRRMLAADQVSTGTARPQCIWQNYNEFCTPLLTNWLQFKGTPSSPFLRAKLAAKARDDHCRNSYKTAEACCASDNTYRCTWRHQNNTCEASDAIELKTYELGYFLPSYLIIPPAMACPGSKAADFQSCTGRLPNACGDAPSNCFLDPSMYDGKVCLPKFAKGWSTEQLSQLVKRIDAADPQVFGNCEAACWVRQAKKCYDTSRRGKDACSKLPYCEYLSGTCYRTTSDFNQSSEYDIKVRKLYNLCSSAKSKKECEASNEAKLQVANDNVWKDYKQPTGAVQCKL